MFIAILLLLATTSTTGAQVYYAGCFSESSVPNKDLPATSADMVTASNSLCASQCRSAGYLFSGTGYHSYCSCGNDFGKFDAKVPLSEANCNTDCAGNPSEMCGGNYKNSIYVALDTTFMGCFTFNSSIAVAAAAADGVSPAACIGHCLRNNMSLALMTGGSTCYCSTSYKSFNSTTPLSSHLCNATCQNTSHCGGVNTVSVHYSRRCDLSTLPVAGTIEELWLTWARVRSAGVDTNITCGLQNWNQTLPSVAGMAVKSYYAGCFRDYVDGATRDLPVIVGVGSPATIEYCVNYCKTAGYFFAGPSASSWCDCGNDYGKFDNKIPVSENYCNMLCSANQFQFCGGWYMNAVYLALDSTLLGCFNMPTNYTLIVPGNETVSAVSCISYCLRHDLPLTIMYNASACYCSADYITYNSTTPLSNVRCNASCQYPSHCGGVDAVSVHYSRSCDLPTLDPSVTLDQLWLSYATLRCKAGLTFPSGATLNNITCTAQTWTGNSQCYGPTTAATTVVTTAGATTAVTTAAATTAGATTVAATPAAATTAGAPTTVTTTSTTTAATTISTTTPATTTTTPTITTTTTGLSSTTAITVCQSSPCMNGASCQLVPVPTSYTCICQNGFCGVYCELTVCSPPGILVPILKSEMITFMDNFVPSFLFDSTPFNYAATGYHSAPWMRVHLIRQAVVSTIKLFGMRMLSVDLSAATASLLVISGNNRFTCNTMKLPWSSVELVNCPGHPSGDAIEVRVEGAGFASIILGEIQVYE